MKDKQSKEKYVYQVFQNIAGGYDRANRRISLGLHMRWKRAAASCLLASICGGDCGEKVRILDLGCGTGDMLNIMAGIDPSIKLTGLDFSPNMLRIARKNCRDIPGLQLVRGNACQLSFSDDTFDGVTISFALRNTADYDRVIQEAFRVLKPGGYFLCIDSFVPSSPLVQPFYHLYFSTIMPLLGGGWKKFKEYRWLRKSTREFISVEELKKRMRQAGFGRIKDRNFLFGACAYAMGRKARK